ncbi:MAG: MFS transporter [Anaerolineaceae bacterium]|nr:MFS transporter [Anaerolineaceae bacterium]
MATVTEESLANGTSKTRNRSYLIYLMIFTGFVAIMDQYISTVKTTAIPYILEEYNITASDFSWLEAAYLSFTFLIFFLNSLNDIIGRKWSQLVLILFMGISSLAVVFFTSSIHFFMIAYTIAMFATVSNMWTIPVSEESPAKKRAKYVSIVYVIGLIPLQALLPPLLMDRMGLNWKWMYGIMFIFMLPLLVMWFFMKETKRFQIIQSERRAGTRKNHFFGVGVINKQDLRYIAISASVWLSWLVYQFLYYWAGYYFMTIKGYTLSQWSMVLLGTLIMAMIGGVAAGSIMDRIGRKPAMIYGSLILVVVVALLGFVEGIFLPITAVVSGFFTSFTYTWIVVYVPEVFPTERRGACMGWTTTVARVSYVVGPALAAVLLKAFPTMEWFWVITGSLMLVPVAIILFSNPQETKTMELEEIEVER